MWKKFVEFFGKDEVVGSIESGNEFCVLVIIYVLSKSVVKKFL